MSAEADRLTDVDRETVSDAIAEAASKWYAGGLTVWLASDFAALERVGAHAIGCSTYDLRAVELDWIAARARELAGRVGVRARRVAS